MAAEPAYDAVLVVSFGGPERPEDVEPFLRRVTRGRSIPAERLAEVAENYRAVGGASPLNEINRAFTAALHAGLASAGLPMPVFLGNRNSAPFVEDAVAEMASAGVRRALAYVTSPYASYSSCRQYQDDIAAARATVGDAAPRIERLRHAFDHPVFIDFYADAAISALGVLPREVRDEASLLFTAHSVPMEMAKASGVDGFLYPKQLAAAATLVTDAVQTRTGVERPWLLTFQSRSGAPTTPWLEPDVSDVVTGGSVRAGVVVPIGFVADHMEVVYDLDVALATRAQEAGVPISRAATLGASNAHVELAVDLVRERLNPGTPRRALSPLGPAWDVCPAGCCRMPGEGRVAGG